MTVGEALAVRLARALMPERCRRARFVAGAGRKDANDALQAGWGRAEFERAIAEASAMRGRGGRCGERPGRELPEGLR